MYVFLSSFFPSLVETGCYYVAQAVLKLSVLHLWRSRVTGVCWEEHLVAILFLEASSQWAESS